MGERGDRVNKEHVKMDTQRQKGVFHVFILFLFCLLMGKCIFFLSHFSCVLPFSYIFVLLLMISVVIITLFIFTLSWSTFKIYTIFKTSEEYYNCIIEILFLTLYPLGFYIVLL